MGFVSTPHGVDAAAGPEPPERARAESLAQARTALAAAVLTEPQGRTACLRILEPLVHHGRLRRTALLLERPVPAWVEGHVLGLHAQAGCQRRAPNPAPTDPQELTEALARLPWSGEWLVGLSSTLSGRAAAEMSPVAETWVACRNAFVEGHRGLVASIARRYLGRSGLSRDDLIQEGLLALCRAVERYEPGRGTRFSSYAVPVLQRAMVHAIRAMGNPPAAPHQLSRTSVAGCPLRSRGPATAGRLRFRPPALVSVDATVDGPDDPSTLADRLADPSVLTPDVSAIRSIEHHRLRTAFGTLPRDAQHVLALHWGLGDGAAQSVHQMTRLLGRSEEDIRAIIATSRRLLRDLLNWAQPRPPNCAQIAPAGYQAADQHLAWRASARVNGNGCSPVGS